MTETSTGLVPDSGALVLFTHLARTSLFLDALQEECLESYGLSFGDYSVLRVLRYCGPPHRLSPKNLADTVVRTTGGMTKIIEAVRQLRGQAHPRVQVPNCDLALAHGTGGLLGVRHAASTCILERV